MASAYNDLSAEPDTVVIIHGLWLTPRCWEHWLGYYADAGFHVVTPAWPGVEIEVEALRENPSVLAGLGVGVGEVADHIEKQVRQLSRPRS